MGILDFNVWYEKVIYFNCKINKITIIGKVISVMFNCLIRLIFNCDISPDAQIGKNVKIPHAVGIVIGSTAIIGNNTVIMPNVVIGAKEYPPKKLKRHATVGENCLIGANVVIIGDINVGENCLIAAGTTVIKDIVSNTKFYGK